MKLLISCVHSDYCLLGYDSEAEHVFWKCSSKRFKACGINYHGNDFLVATSNMLTRFGSDGTVNVTRFEGLGNPRFHSVHPINDELVGVVDTGRSQVLFLSKDTQIVRCLSPFQFWGDDRDDAVHMNDFAMTRHGLFASCFGYRPWRDVMAEQKSESPDENFGIQRQGLLINLLDNDNKETGRIVGCGFTLPHSITVVEDTLYICSSLPAAFHVCQISDNGLVQHSNTINFPPVYILRGALKHDDGWFLGGSTHRHSGIGHAAIFQLNNNLELIKTSAIGHVTEIYDVLPWRDDIMNNIAAVMYD